MSDYRFYSLGGDGHISWGQWFEADSDLEAVLKAGDIKHDAHMHEVWFEGRMVAKTGPSGRLETIVP